MENQKIINSLDNTNNKPSKFRTKNWVEVNNDAHETCNTNSQIKLKNWMLKSSLCDYIDGYILVKGAIAVLRQGTAVVAIAADRNNK